MRVDVMQRHEWDVEWDFSDSPGYVEKVIFHIVHVDPELLPDCMVNTRYSCKLCPAAQFSRCLLKVDPDFASLVRITSGTISKLNGIRLRDVMLIELEKFGLPVHYDLLHKAVLKELPKASSQWVLRVLSTYTNTFVKVEIGVYGLAKWKTK